MTKSGNSTIVLYSIDNYYFSLLFWTQTSTCCIFSTRGGMFIFWGGNVIKFTYDFFYARNLSYVKNVSLIIPKKAHNKVTLALGVKISRLPFLFANHFFPFLYLWTPNKLLEMKKTSNKFSVFQPFSLYRTLWELKNDCLKPSTFLIRLFFLYSFQKFLI